ncbi:MAG: LysR family transcriptional regulator [Steroidobacteraceae bacterium]|jgi:DNA-binding transcriptional LysR family regulator|nr:LysR family transcriptional regulator [Steroidobacteraceae bacterium]
MAVPKTSADQWAVLSAVVELGSYAKAAAALHRSQPAVSYAIANLQESLGVKLLEIQGRRAVLTAHGDTLLKRARSVLRELETVERLAQVLKRGWEPRLRLVVDAAFPRSRLLEIVAEAQARCADTQLQLEDAVLSGAEEAITEGTADVVITTQVPPGVLGTWLLDVTFIAVANPAHALFKDARDLDAADLERHTQAVVRDSGRLHPRDSGWLGSVSRCTVTSVEASLALVRAGLAFAWLPEQLVAEPLHAGELRALPLTAGATRKVPLYLVLVKPALAGPAAQVVMESFQRHIPAVPGVV